MSTLLEPEVLPPTELAIEVPAELTAVVANSSAFEIAAKEYTVDSEASFQVADQIQATLKAEAKKINDQRMELTRPIDAFKKKIVEFFALAVDGRTQAAYIYQQKMSEFKRAKILEAENARRDAERLLREQREQEEAKARELELKAEQLKTPAAKARVLAEAEQHRQVAALTPETVALSAPEPKTVASNVAELWELDKLLSIRDFLHWLADHPEWHTLVVDPKTGKVHFPIGEMNRMAKQFRNAVPVPGIRFHSKDSFRTKAR